MKKYHISIFISLVSIIGIIYQNYRIAQIFNESRGKNRALFGITELTRLDVKLYLGLALIVSFIFGILSIRKREDFYFSILSVVLSFIGINLLFIKVWTWMI
ncbi:hypothetical protein IVB69_12985 [Flavobacterium sp. J49]|uniref:Uncharacterized protein n=1 Tax=Flavobacterium rivulicola TaxID=2732161 RepID=A0A7Y3R930_9FLAO|nr:MULTISPECIES: hypothetical protein [unclassified Flavobacterium]MBF6642399.1 hypothetical protein [Flavobacterium sp. J49]NIC03645.1 hypothetical protein [Flavobacterium sp. J49]NNT72144.1 hypothetical protein [Flavobacterium sp. IMCC34852]NNT73256.1 hypothetical protein [Flavobacterium sp. IMCC34852]